MADEPVTQSMIDDMLVDWVISTVQPWEDHRRSEYETSWTEYYHQWKGEWTSAQKTRQSERSKFISPALAQAIEMAVSEMEEATFARKNWVDFDDDIADPVKEDMAPMRRQFIEDMDLAQVPQNISEVYLNSALYGTGIAKIVVSEKDEFITGEGGTPEESTRVENALVPVSPFEFAIDPAAKKVNEGLGAAHITVLPKIDVIKKQEQGIYNDVALGSYSDDKGLGPESESRSAVADKTEIVEYHGLVPAALLIAIEDEDGNIDEIAAEMAADFDEVEMVEAIVTIGNREVLLRANQNPFLHKDRSFIAFQHDTMPNRFWGRGVAEKGIQSQRALNAELRARQDGLALTIHPMMAVDATRLPRGAKLSVSPGKTILTNGDPSTVLRPFKFGDMSAHTYTEAGELERMMQMATGSMDSATPSNISPRNGTASGMSMIGAGSIKRSKRTMRNIENDFLKPMINKMAWRYQQFDPARYPYGDYKLIPYSTMGMMAREFEQTQIAMVLQSMPDGPAKAVLLKGFIENSSIALKQELEQALEVTFNPQPDPMQQQVQMLQLENAMLENEKLKRELEKIQSETVENYANAASKQEQTDVNKFNAIANVENQELDRQVFDPRKSE